MFTRTLVLSFIALCVCLCLVWSTDAQQLPIPSRPLGIRSGSSKAPVQILEFFDLQCPDCMSAWPVVARVLDHYGPDVVQYTGIIYPLWLHRQAWDLSKAASIVMMKAPNQIVPFVTHMFSKQPDYYNSVWHNRTEAQLYDALADDCAQFGVPRAVFMQWIDSDAAYELSDMQMHLGIAHQVMGTPSFFINGFLNSTLSSGATTFEQWTAMIDALLASN